MTYKMASKGMKIVLAGTIEIDKGRFSISFVLSLKIDQAKNLFQLNNMKTLLVFNRFPLSNILLVVLALLLYEILKRKNYKVVIILRFNLELSKRLIQ